MLVIGAGKSTPTLAAASGAVEQGLRSSGKTDLVMNGKSLGNTETLDDTQILGKAAGLPIKLVAIVRVFEDPAPAVAVVTVYGAKGAVEFAVSGKAGAPIDGRKASANSSGVTSGAARSIAETTLASHTSDSKARKEYEEKGIWFKGHVMVGAGQVSVWTTPMKGKYGPAIDGDELYDLLGHPEMEVKYKEVESKNHVVTGVAIAAAVVSLGVGIGLAANDQTVPGIILAAGGPLILPWIIGSIGYADPNPVDAPTRQKMIDEYNAKLRRDLGLPEQEEDEALAAPPAPRGPSFQLTSAAFVPTANGGAFGVAGRF